MIDANHSAALHRSAEAIGEQPIPVPLNPLRMEGGQVPPLPLRREQLRWGADGGLRNQLVLKRPGITSLGMQANRQVLVEADRHSNGCRGLLDSPELKMALPLDIPEEVGPSMVSPAPLLNVWGLGISILWWPCAPSLAG